MTSKGQSNCQGPSLRFRKYRRISFYLMISNQTLVRVAFFQKIMSMFSHFLRNVDDWRRFGVLLPTRRSGLGGRDELRADEWLLLPEPSETTDLLPLLLVLRATENVDEWLLSSASRSISRQPAFALRRLLRSGRSSFKNCLNDFSFCNVGLRRCVSDDEDDDLP